MKCRLKKNDVCLIRCYTTWKKVALTLIHMYFLFFRTLLPDQNQLIELLSKNKCSMSVACPPFYFINVLHVCSGGEGRKKKNVRTWHGPDLNTHLCGHIACVPACLSYYESSASSTWSSLTETAWYMKDSVKLRCWTEALCKTPPHESSCVMFSTDNPSVTQCWIYTMKRL